MFQVLIGKDVAYAAKQGGSTISGIHQLDLLAAGAFAVFTEDNVLISSSASAGDHAGKNFQIFVGSNTNNPAGGIYPTRSGMIKSSGLKAVKKSYAAPALPVITVGGSASAINLPATLVTGDVATIKIWKDGEIVDPLNPLGNRSTNVRTFKGDPINVEVRVTPTMTQDQLIAAVVAAINAHANNNYVTAAVSGTYAGTNLAITLTGTINYQTFEVAVDDLLSEATVATTTAIDFGHGAPSQMLELEQKALIEEGDTARIKFASQMFQRPSQVSSTETYATWDFFWLDDKGSDLGNQGRVNNQVVVGVGDGDTIETNLTTIFAALSLTVADGDGW